LQRSPKGPVPVIRITTPLAEMAPFWYMLLAFPVLGMLVADLFDLWRARGLSLPTVELGLQIALIVALSSLRLGVRIPLSGHALLADGRIASSIAYFFVPCWSHRFPQISEKTGSGPRPPGLDCVRIASELRLDPVGTGVGRLLGSM
jgi:hypothetical protein